MPSLTLADARDLERWASSRRAQEQLPALVRRLIHATTTTASHVGLPAGDAIQHGGYDGVVRINETQFAVPDGVSIWEFGVSRNPKEKADHDYGKRKARQPESDVGPIDPATTAFVFVTPRRWNAKARWLAARRAEGFWRDVQVLDADDLEAWLEQAPAVHVWLSTLLGRRPRGADDLEAVWQDWSESTTPPLSPALMFAGRESTRDAIREWFTSGSADPTLGVESESPEETVSLVAASLLSLPEDERVAVLARSVVVRDADALIQLAAADESLRILTAFSPGDLAQRATRGGHRVLIPRSPGEGVTGTLHVPRLHREAAERELTAMGLPQDRSRELAGLARRSLLALRRRLATSAAVVRPPWASPAVGPAVLSILLLGAVNEDVPGDVEVLALLSGEPGDGYLARLAQMAAEVDPPVRRVGSVWYLISKEDAWEALAHFLTRHTLERFVTVAVGVLGSPDPAFDLPPEQRWAAGIYVERPPHSGLLIRGIADTLALLGARGAGNSIATGVSAADYATRTVRELFEQAGRDWQRWASLAPVFPQLMEAAPDATLSAIEAGLGGTDAPPVIGLFGHDVDSFVSSSPHTYLLWALERAAWSRDQFGRAVLILAELARRDPGGRLSNRPGESLRSIFLPWVPSTAAPVDARLDAIDVLRRREPEAAWALMSAILPKAHDHSTPTDRPVWREWAPDARAPVTYRMLAEHAGEIVRRMLEDAGTSSARWARLVEALDDVPRDAHQAILARLSDLAETSLPCESRAEIWHALRELVSRHRSYADAEWALPTERLDDIAGVLERFEPADVVARDGYLFSHHPSLPEGGEQDFDAFDQRLAARRMEAAAEWYRALGADEIVRVAGELERSDALGDALAACGVVPPSIEPLLLRRALGHAEPPARLLGRAYLARRVFAIGDTVPAFLRRNGLGWPAQVVAEALLAMPPGTEAWDGAESLEEEGRRHYWQNVFVHRGDALELERAVRELGRYGRPHAALDLAAMYVRRDPKLSAETVRQVLLAAAPVARDVTGYRSQSYDVSELLSFLEQEAEAGRITEDEVVRLELFYLPLLRHDRDPKLLHKAMGQEPSLFVEAVCLAFRGENEPERDLDEEGRDRAALAHHLLRSWHTPPGLRDGEIDGEHLDAWVDEARRRLAGHDRRAIGDQLIGQVLSGSPAGTDGAWPAEPVREVIERLRSDDIEAGLHMGRFNQRGVVTRNPLSGGALERSLKDRYEADAAKLAARWPRTAAFLRACAATYDRDAAREDVSAELRHDLDS